MTAQLRIARHVTPSGYINSNGGREHVVVAALAFGGLLPQGYVVHHINENKSDNRPANLVICEDQRLHFILHTLPGMIDDCIWLGPIGRSVRLFKTFWPSGMSFCIRCRRSKMLKFFQRSSKYRSGVRGECSSCRGIQNRETRRIYRERHPRLPATPIPRPGEKNPAAKLTAREVIAIRKAYIGGERQVALAIRYGVSQSEISLIVLRKHWKHI
jgi:HNH endonuclease